MADYYEQENACVRCLRNSPIASLLGFIAVLIGGGAFGGATIFARRFLDDMLNAPHLFPCLEYTVYGLIGTTGLFAAIAYFVCAVSSGRNAKQCFESSQKSACGRCCNMLSIICLVFGILFWVAILCLMSYPLVSISLLLHRHDGPTRLRLAALNPASLIRERRAPQDRLQYRHPQLIQSKASYLLQNSDGDTTSFKNPDGAWVDNSMIQGATPSPSFLAAQGLESTFQQQPSPNEAFNANQYLTTNNLAANPNVVLSNQVPQNIPDKLKQQGKDLMIGLAESAMQFFKCDPATFDLSYYGLYDENGLPIHVAQDTFMASIKPIMICVCVAVGGTFLMVLGYLQILICMAMNFARLQERRYYEASDAGEEGVALQQ